MADDTRVQAAELRPLLDEALTRVEGLQADADAVRQTMPPKAAAVFDETLHELGAAFAELQVAVEDLTDKSQQLAASERRYADLFHQTADGLLVTDASGMIREANAQAASMLSATPDQLVGKPLVLFVSPVDRRRLHSALWTLQSDTPRMQLDVLVHPRTGPPFPGSLHVRAEGDPDHRTALRWAVRDDTDKAALQDQLVFHARHDSLTGLLNRNRFLETLQQELGDAHAAAQEVAVLFVDLDRFKTVNDRLGHQAGDEVLGAAAARIREAVRDDDLVARLGGDEFAVACRLTDDVEEAVKLAHRVRDALAEPFVLGDARATVGATVGIATGTGGAVAAQDLLRRADQAMYAAKRSGGRIQIYDRDLQQVVTRRVDTEAGLASALRNGDFRVLYQPQVSLVDGRLVGVEALVRWRRRPDVPPIAASAFVGVAEDSGILTAIDAWVVDQACRDAVTWGGLGLPDGFTVAVNVSSADLADPGFEDRLLDVLCATGLPAASLCLEVTERSALDALGTAENVLSRLHEHGIKIAIDDFGTGYSALSYLRRLPIDLVKIDKSFVERLAAMREDRLIVASVVGLAEVIGFTVVAEGVEHPDQIKALLRGGCSQAQGYLLSLPVTAGEITTMLEQGWRADVT